MEVLTATTGRFKAILYFFTNAIPVGAAYANLTGTKDVFGADTFTFTQKPEITVNLDGDGVVGYARKGDLVILATNVAGYSKDLADVAEFEFTNASNQTRYIVTGVCEVDMTDFYTPFADAAVDAVAFIDASYAGNIRKMTSLPAGRQPVLPASKSPLMIGATSNAIKY